VLVCGIPGCNRNADRSAVIARVNGTDVHKSEFDRFLSLKMGDLTGSELPDAIRSQMLDEYVTRRIVLVEAGRANLSVTDAELEQASVQNPQMKSTASSEDARAELINDLLVEKYYHQVVLKDVKVSTDEVQQYLEANKGRLTDRPAFYIREIRVDTEAEANRLLVEIGEGERDFGEIARLHSQAPSAEQGGLARYSEGQLPSVLDKTIAKLAPGDVSPVVQSSYGYHIFKLERRVQLHAPDERRSQLDERRSALIEELIARKNQEAVDQGIARIVSSADIEIHPTALGFTYSGKLRHN
jgi:parvulin-like peptidyl-prolyl isomerase